MSCRICSKTPVYRKKLGLCRSCYDKKRRREKAILCPVSGCNRKQYRGGKCRPCRGHKNTSGKPKTGLCSRCRKEKLIQAKGMCSACYQTHRLYIPGSSDQIKARKRRQETQAGIEATNDAFATLLSNTRKKQGKTPE